MFDIFIMDMGGHDQNVQCLRQRFPHARVLRWTDHLHTIRRAMPQCRTRYAWIVSSCIDYTGFDWLWEPAPWQSHQIHCWPSAQQQFGDTFLVPAQAWSQQQTGLEHLEHYQDVNFEHDSLPRLPWQRVEYQHGTIPEVMRTTTLTTPYAWFTNQTLEPQSDPWLWRECPVISEATDNGSVLMPRSAVAHVHDQIYDYAWIDKSSRAMNPAPPLDVVFISNGEHQADNNYQHLRWAVERTDSNRITHVAGVNGRVAAYHAAAQASRTDWFFAVFAKLEVDQNFDWSWQPDRMQQAKHYIFHARNPVNGLLYGHQAMIAYNRELVLSNPGQGLDFTLDQPHEVVPILSGTAFYTTTPWMAWRTAFREALKLRHSLPDTENEYRLRQWLKHPKHIHPHSYDIWSAWGAQDAMEYYDEVQGDFDQLRKSYEWSWLASYALLRRNLAADR